MSKHKAPSRRSVLFGRLPFASVTGERAPRVVILGSGYVTVWTYRALRRRFGAGIDITVISPYDFHVYHGFTGEVLGGEVAAHWQESSLAEATPHASHVPGYALAVDTRARLVTVEHDGQRSQVGYDYLVVGTGALEYGDKIPGLGEHSLPMQAAGRPAAVIAKMNENLRASTQASDPAEVERLSTVVVVGAGLAGTETSAALSRRMIASGHTGKVVLIASQDMPVPQWKDRPYLQRKALGELTREGVQLLSGTRVARIEADQVVLSDGQVIPAALVVNAVGTKAVVPEGLHELCADSGRLVVAADLSVTDRVWAAGDAAEVLRPNGEVAPKDALWALRAGTVIGRNIARAIRGEGPKDFRYTELGVVTTFGTGSAVGHMHGVPLTGWLSWTMSGAIFLWFLPSRPQALRMMKAMVNGTVADPTLRSGSGVIRLPSQVRREVLARDLARAAQDR